MAYAATISSTLNFFYTCTGAEGDTFPILFTTLRSDTNYVAIITLAKSTLSAQYLCNAPPQFYTTAGLTCVTGAPVASGDVLAVHVAEVSQ